MERFNTGQVCLNGHKITGNSNDAASSKFCAKCGEPTIIACPSCKSPIRGSLDGEYMTAPMRVTSFCHDCGTPYPWTERAVAAAKELADEIEDIDPADLAKAKESFIALASDTPQTTVAVARVKKLIAKAGPIIGGGIRDLVVSISTEAAKKALGI